MPGNCRPSSSLAALLGAAAALTGNVHAQSAVDSADDARASYRFNQYAEDSLDGRFIGNAERYRVDSQQFELLTPLTDGRSLDLTATHEVMSGSSPWFVLRGDNNVPVQVLSGATIRDHRSELAAALTSGAGHGNNSTWSLSYSHERDYSATALGWQQSIPHGQAMTFGLGASVSHDIIEPTDAQLYDRIRHDEKNTVSGFGSVAWVLDRSSVLQTGVQLNFSAGYLSDPYKLVSAGDELLADNRPRRRSEGAWLLRYRRVFVGADAAVHLDYRFARDSWGVSAHTLEVGWYQRLDRDWYLIPALRYYAQHQARFYSPYFDVADADRFMSSDYRLGTFGAFSASLDLRKRFGNWELSIGMERYRAATDYAPGGGGLAVPGVVSYSLAMIGLDWHFK